ncbi:HD domain-containing protein [Aerococcus urinae]|uniref:HD domain-containing protein n=1 Tax=Aerococcus urinae TaxID=1376 RepID=UPI0018E1D2C8|nr:HD domain-containing protein [Aerococcus urinae]
MSFEQANRRIREKVFRDPVHGYIHIQHQIFLDLINTKEFQRLRRVKQLGTTSFTFHGADHTRFAHCLGVYEIARRIVNQFQRNYSSQELGDGLWDDQERLVVLCAAILHDIGHGAFSHTFEKLFGTDHEAVTRAIITSPETEVNRILTTVSPDFPNKVAAVINHSYPNPQVVQLISSQCDADRMDYLLRDSYFTGAEYGAFDLNRILRVMRPYQGGIMFDYAGMHAVEDYIVSRYQMYMQVYFHPVSRAMEMILNRLLKRAKDLYQDNPKYFIKHSPLLVPFLKNEWTLTDYLHVDDGVMETYFQHWILTSDDPILVDLSKRFINRKPFKSVTFDSNSQAETAQDLQEKISQMGYDVNYYTAYNSNYDLPYDLYDPSQKNPRTQIELLEKDGTIIELSEASQLIRAFTGQELGDERLYFPNELYYGKNHDKISLFEPDLKAIHDMTKTGKLKALD